MIIPGWIKKIVVNDDAQASYINKTMSNKTIKKCALRYWSKDTIKYIADRPQYYRRGDIAMYLQWSRKHAERVTDKNAMCVLDYIRQDLPDIGGLELNTDIYDRVHEWCVFTIYRRRWAVCRASADASTQTCELL